MLQAQKHCFIKLVGMSATRLSHVPSSIGVLVIEFKATQHFRTVMTHYGSEKQIVFDAGQTTVTSLAEFERPPRPWYEFSVAENCLTCDIYKKQRTLLSP